MFMKRLMGLSVVLLLGSSVSYAGLSHVSSSSSSSSSSSASALPAPLRVVPSQPGQALPKDAFTAAHVGANNLYLCSASYQGGVHPGVVTQRGCRITYAGKVRWLSHYGLLAGGAGRLYWHDGSSYWGESGRALRGALPEGLKLPASSINRPVLMGYEGAPGSYAFHGLYACRTMFHDQIHLGKVVSRHCNVAWKGDEYMLPTYQVLFYAADGAAAHQPPHVVMPAPVIIPLGPALLRGS
jgi:hypothetical protein